MTGQRGRMLELQLQGYRLSTAEILYHLPDHPALLQTFLWQQLDLAPKFPKRLHSVRVVNARLIKPAEFRAIDGILALH